MDEQKIGDFYENKEIFVTGATGFMGKVLIEKLLRSCPKLKTIYILIRFKKGKSIDERLNEMFELPLFDKLRSANACYLKKVIPVNGDIFEENLGLIYNDMERLSHVSIIFHSAASVRFDEPLREAILKNTRGTYEIVKFAKTLKNIVALIHVSTSYCYSDRFTIEEKLYPPYGNWKNSINIAKNFDNEILEIFNQKYCCFQPNTYIFSKNLAEHVIDSFKNDVPCVIFRPTIVISTVCDPIPGWIDNFNGPVGMLLACGTGLIKTMHADKYVAPDYVPVDIAIKALIISAYKRGITDNKNELQIYNCSTGSLKAVKLQELIDYGKCITEENPIEKTLFYPSGGITKCSYSPMMHPIFMTFPVDGIVIANDKFFCNEITCSIDLRQLTRKSSGTYRCEVSGDAPEFKLTTKTSNMTVAALPQRDPAISVLNPTYRLDELVAANCSSDWSSPPAVLSWYINNEKALPEWLQPQHETTTHVEEFTLRLRTLELRFYLNNQIFMSSKGIIYLKCVADIEHFPILRREHIKTAYVLFDDDLNNQKLINHWVSNGKQRKSSTAEAISFLIIIGFLYNYITVSSSILEINSPRDITR